MTTDVINTTGTWTCPAGVYWAEVDCVGAGGGGENGQTGTKGAGGAGGQGARNPALAVVPGNVYDVTVGTGGAGGTTTSPLTGQAGGDSIFAYSGTELVKGKGGAGASSNTAGAGSTANGIGLAIIAGGNGAAGGSQILGTGGAGATIGAITGGAGATASAGGAAGNAGTAPGGGGGGGGNNAAAAGGAGATGRVSITYTVPPGPQLVQWKGAGTPSSATSVSVVLDATPTAGNLLIAVLTYPNTISGPTHPFGSAPDYTAANGVIVAAVYSKTATGSESTTVTFSNSNSRQFTLLVMEFEPGSPGATWAMDETASATAGSVNTIAVGPTATLDDTDEIAVVGIGSNGTIGGAAPSFNSGFAALAGIGDPLHRGFSGYKMLSGSSAVSTTASLVTSVVGLAAALVTYKEVGGAPPPAGDIKHKKADGTVVDVTPKYKNENGTVVALTAYYKDATGAVSPLQ